LFCFFILFLRRSTRDDAEDEEWGWDDSKTGNVEITGMKLNSSKKLLLRPADGLAIVSEKPQRSSSVRSRGSSQSPINKREPYTIPKPIQQLPPPSDPDDFFEQMGLSAKPRFSSPRPPVPSSMGGMSVIRKSSANLTKATIPKKTARLGATALSSYSDDETGVDDWDDDADLDDLLKD
jgi:hypothetical protein